MKGGVPGKKSVPMEGGLVKKSAQRRTAGGDFISSVVIAKQHQKNGRKLKGVGETQTEPAGKNFRREKAIRSIRRKQGSLRGGKDELKGGADDEKKAAPTPMAEDARRGIGEGKKEEKEC